MLGGGKKQSAFYFLHCYYHTTWVGKKPFRLVRPGLCPLTERGETFRILPAGSNQEDTQLDTRIVTLPCTLLGCSAKLVY